MQQEKNEFAKKKVRCFSTFESMFFFLLLSICELLNATLEEHFVEDFLKESETIKRNLTQTAASDTKKQVHASRLAAI